MPRIEPLPLRAAAPSLQGAWEQHVAEYPGSRITNMKATLSHSPLAFRVYMEWYPLYHEVIEITGERLAYLFAHAISEASNCPLCTLFFRKIIIQNGERLEDLVLTEVEQELLDFGAEFAQNRGEISDPVYQKIAARYARDQVVVLVAFAGQMVATNLFNNALHVEIDDYLTPYLPLTQ
ncbi:MAG: hypothetical protein H7Y12_03890 [Sphingobacteriaceae bacterium]|nr:hypothetical protein [Cytophagaceae bacterium]